MITAVFPVLGALLVPAFGEALGLLWLWAILGALLTAASLLVPSLILSLGLRQLELPLETLSMPGVRSRAGAPAARRFLAPQLAWDKAVPVFQRALIAGMAFAAAVALLGMVSLLTGCGWGGSVGFFLVVGALQGFHFPTQRRVLSALEAAYDAELEL